MSDLAPPVNCPKASGDLMIDYTSDNTFILSNTARYKTKLDFGLLLATLIEVRCDV